MLSDAEYEYNSLSSLWNVMGDKRSTLEYRELAIKRLDVFLAKVETYRDRDVEESIDYFVHQLRYNFHQNTQEALNRARAIRSTMKFIPIRAKRKAKPHNGKIKNWYKIENYLAPGLGYRIAGEFIDYKRFRGQLGQTSWVIAHDEATGEIETRLHRYTLVGEMSV